MTFGIFWLTSGLLLGAAVLGGRALRQWRRRMRRFHWHFATHDGGRHVHAIPAGDVDHIEDHDANCRCCPWSEPFERTDGSFGQAIYHQRIRR